jgi:hypothetical protein
MKKITVEKQVTRKFTCHNMHSRDSYWFRATESPTKARVFPLINSKKALASKAGRSHP